MAGLTGKIGATGRFWSRAGLGVQLEVLRAARTQTATATRVTALQFAPGVLYRAAEPRERLHLDPSLRCRRADDSSFDGAAGRSGDQLTGQ